VRRTPEGIVVPYFARIGERYREKLFPGDGSCKTRWLGPSKPQIPYGLEDLRLGNDVVILTEGESDTLALRLAFPTVTAIGIPGASAWRPEWRVYLEDFRRIYLSFDADRAGRELLDAVKADVPEYRSILLPEGADTRDFLQLLGRRAYKVLVDVADRAWEQRQAWDALDAAVWRRRKVEIAWERRAA
jgi:DNA primase